MLSERFAGRLRELRTAAGLSQKDLADKAGVTVRQISRMETAAQGATWETVLALCAALGVDCTAFTVEPADAPASPRGRPRKPTDQHKQAAAGSARPASADKSARAKKKKK